MPWTNFSIYFGTYTAHHIDAYYNNRTPNLHSCLTKKRIYFTIFLFSKHYIVWADFVNLFSYASLTYDISFYTTKRTRFNCFDIELRATKRNPFDDIGFDFCVRLNVFFYLLHACYTIYIFNLIYNEINNSPGDVLGLIFPV